MSPMAAIQASTSVAAELLAVADRCGTLEAGKLADVIGVAVDPLDDPKAIGDPDRVRLVIKDGGVVKDLDGRMPGA
jgi:imidazolonepropionase-like amidohydrolase